MAGPITFNTSCTPGWRQSQDRENWCNPWRARAGNWINHCNRAPSRVLPASTAPPSTAFSGRAIAGPSCHQSRPRPAITARLESRGLTEGNQNSSAALRAPKPRPIRPASRAIGAIQRSSSTAMAWRGPSRPGPTRVIRGSAATTSSTVTPTRATPTRVLIVASTWAPSSRGRRANTLTMALWKGPLMPPSNTNRKPGRT